MLAERARLAFALRKIQRKDGREKKGQRETRAQFTSCVTGTKKIVFYLQDVCVCSSKKSRISARADAKIAVNGAKTESEGYSHRQSQ